MEMTGAYACIANQGIAVYPYYIESIHDLDGKVYDTFKSKESGKRAFSKETAQLVTRMMQTVVHEGTASRLRWRYGVLNDVAGKTGTTQANADGWFIAMTPNLVIGSWVGADDPRIRFRYTELGQGSSTALPMVAHFLKRVNQDTTFKKISLAKFQPLPRDLQMELDCDLYELSDECGSRSSILFTNVIHSFKLIHRLRRRMRHSWKSYTRGKLKIMKANAPDSSKVTELRILGG
jgi:penicillin-binding protein 1A